MFRPGVLPLRQSQGSRLSRSSLVTATLGGFNLPSPFLGRLIRFDTLATKTDRAGAAPQFTGRTRNGCRASGFGLQTFPNRGPQFGHHMRVLRRFRLGQLKGRANFSIRLEQDDGGLRFVADEVEHYLKWRGIGRILVEHDGVVVSHRNLFFLVPDAAFAGAEERLSFIRDVYDHLNASARAISEKHVRAVLKDGVQGSSTSHNRPTITRTNTERRFSPAVLSPCGDRIFILQT